VILSDTDVVRTAELLIGSPTPKTKTQKPVTLEEMEKQFILESLDANDRNVSLTARVLGMTRTALYRRMKKYGIS